MPIDATVRALLERDPEDVHVALVGASTNTSKYGNIILKDLLRKKFVVHPINPNREPIDGRDVHVTVEEAPDPIHIVNVVIPPPATKALLESLDPKRYPVVWLQPGSFDSAVATLARERFAHAVIGDCIMVETR